MAERYLQRNSDVGGHFYANDAGLLFGGPRSLALVTTERIQGDDGAVGGVGDDRMPFLFDEFVVTVRAVLVECWVVVRYLIRQTSVTHWPR